MPVPAPAAPAPLVRKPVMLVGDPSGSEPGDGGPVPVELQYVGVGDLHQRWFGDQEIVARLAKELGPCMTGRAVVRMSWDEEVRKGGIWLLLAGDQLVCRPGAGEAVDLSPLSPLMQALTAYRDQVAGRFDFRVASFEVGLEVLDRTHLCRMKAGGQFPPDGSTFDACIDMGGEVRCLPDRERGHTVFAYPDVTHTRYLGACFKP